MVLFDCYIPWVLVPNAVASMVSVLSREISETLANTRKLFIRRTLNAFWKGLTLAYLPLRHCVFGRDFLQLVIRLSFWG
jgi:hypothetical protein